jgi:hypothetical protein
LWLLNLPDGQSAVKIAGGGWLNQIFPDNQIFSLKFGHFSKLRLKRCADDAEAAEAGGSNNGLTVKIRCFRVIRASIS